MDTILKYSAEIIAHPVGDKFRPALKIGDSISFDIDGDATTVFDTPAAAIAYAKERKQIVKNRNEILRNREKEQAKGDVWFVGLLFAYSLIVGSLIVVFDFEAIGIVSTMMAGIPILWFLLRKLA